MVNGGSILIIHDVGIHSLKNGMANELDGFFLGTFWWMRTEKPFMFVSTMSRKGGVKKAYGIPDNVLYVAGSDRSFVRDPIFELREAVCLKPDVIQVHDHSLAPDDNEDRVVEKLAINRVTLEKADEWLRNAGMRDRFMLLGVVQGDNPETYLEEARVMSKTAEIIGIPVAGLTTKRKYNYVKEILLPIAKEVRKPIQLMGWGSSSIREVRDLVEIAKKLDAFFWLEGSTAIRNSIQHRVLCLNPKSQKLDYKNIASVKGAKGFTKTDCLNYNNKTLKGIISQFLGA